MDDPTLRDQHPDVLRIVEERELPYPLVAINGDLEIAGSAEFYHILPLVEEALAQSPAGVAAE